MRTHKTIRLVLLLSLAFVHNALNTTAAACDLKKCNALFPFSTGEGGQRPDEAAKPE